MSAAWARLVNSNGSDEHLALCNEALAEVRAEIRAQTLRGASQRIHGSIPTGQRIDGGSYWQGVDYAARLIDPDDGYND